jgi:hypothetical protein
MGLGIFGIKLWRMSILLDERSAHAEEHTGNLKHVPGRPDLILAPQPSEDPNDPLSRYFIHSYSGLTEQASMAKGNIQLGCLHNFFDHHGNRRPNLDTRHRPSH